MHDAEFAHVHVPPEQQAALSDTIWSADNVELTTVGVDIGSSTSHLMFAHVHLQRLSTALSSRFVVVGREVLWRSPVRLTPYRPDLTIDANALGEFVACAYETAGLHRDDVDSGAVILTGEALKRRNARAIAELFAEQSGKFVCASAGHHLESAMAAHGSGAVRICREHKNTILNVDIGGGTTKFALVQEGQLLATAAVAVGGRLLVEDETGRLTRIETPMRSLAQHLGIKLRKGQALDAEHRRHIVKEMARIVMRLVRQDPVTGITQALMVTEPLPREPRPDAITFSGGVAEYLFNREHGKFNDIGPALAHEIAHLLGHEEAPAPVWDPGQGIRATVVGASQFTVQVSGNTIAVSDPALLPLRNLPVLVCRPPMQDEISPRAVRDEVRRALRQHDLCDGEARVALAFQWHGEPSHARLRALAEGLCSALPKTIARGDPLVFLVDGDVGMTLGAIVRREILPDYQVVSIDNLQLNEFDYVDIGEIIQPTNVVPVIIKSLLF